MYLFLIFIGYQIAQIIALPAIVLYILVRARKKPIFGSRKNFLERLGFVPKPVHTKNSHEQRVIWVHAVSVGETLATEHLVNKIKQEIPNSICYQTTGTIAGRSMITKNIKSDYASFLPFDFLPCMLLAFSRIKPKALIIIEAEQWPNLLMLARIKNIPVYSLSARLSARSFKRFKFFSCIFNPLFNLFTKIFAQTELDAQRYQALGIAPEKITVLGDIKAFNVLEKRRSAELKTRPHPSIPQGERQQDGVRTEPVEILERTTNPTLLVGSVHPGELDVYLELFTNLKQEFKDLKIIIAPRHFHWKQDLVKKINDKNLTYFLWDEQNETTIQTVPEILKNHDVLLVCKLGVLFDLYQFANIFYLGGTFVPVGGHNLLEPAVWANPSFVGPYHANCKTHADALEQAHGLIKTNNIHELITHTEKLLRDKQLRITMAQNSYNWLVHEAACVEKNLAVLFNDLV